MAEANDLYRSIYQNLIDAGCDVQTIFTYRRIIRIRKHRQSLYPGLLER